MSEKKNQLIIVGDSAFAEIAYEYFVFDSTYHVAAFAVEEKFRTKDTFKALPVVSFESMEEFYSPKIYSVFVAVTYIEMNGVRQRLVQGARSKGYNLASYVSSRAFVWRNVRLGEHCFIFEGNTLQPHVELGNNVICWSGNHIGHHSVIADNCFISSHVVISGFCEVGRNSFLGVNCSVGNNVKIGCKNWISPGAVVTRDTANYSMIKSPKPDLRAQTTLEYFGLIPD